MDERDRRVRDKIAGYVYFVLYVALCIIAFALISRCYPGERDDGRDEYVREYFDGAERYDPE